MRRARTFESSFGVDDNFLTETKVLNAYQVLFVGSSQVTSSLLQSVQLPEIKRAYRQRALDTHPDRFVWSDEHHRKLCTERFIEVANAYEILNSYLVLREQGFIFDREASRRRDPLRREPSAPPPQAGYTAPFGDRSQTTFSYSYWEKGIPRRDLRFGEFLYYSRVIPWRSLIGALVWQRKQRPRIGEIAQRWRWFTERQISGLLRLRQPGERLGEILLRHGLISPFQLEVLLWQQQKFQNRIGEYFLLQGLLTEAQLDHYLQQQRQHNLRFHPTFPPSFRRSTSRFQ